MEEVSWSALKLLWEVYGVRGLVTIIDGGYVKPEKRYMFCTFKWGSTEVL